MSLIHNLTSRRNSVTKNFFQSYKYILTFFMVLLVSSTYVHAQTQVLNDVNIANEKYKNIIIVLTNSYVETFPYDQAYGANNYWTKWDVLLHDDNKYSFRLNGKYLSANAEGGIDLVTSMDDTEKFHLEAGNGSYYLKTWRGSYVSAADDGWKRLTQSWEKTSSEEWLFFNSEDPSSGNLNDVNISNFEHKNIMILLTNSYVETFPYDQAYGANNYWTKWDILDNGDGTHSIHLNGKYLAASNADGVDIVSTQSDESKFTLVSGSQGTYYIQSTDGYYVTGQNSGNGWNRLTMSATQSKENQWYFFNRNSVQTYTFSSNQIIDFALVNNVDENVDTIGFVESFTSAPSVFANMQTFSGTDTADLRISGIDTFGFDVFVQEEQSQDTELAHNNETVGFIAFDNGVIFNSDGDAIGEVGSIEFSQDDASEWFTFDHYLGNYSSPVVIMITNTFNGNHASHIRLNNVGATSFEYQLEEWDYLDGTHTSETAVYLIVEAGTHTLADSLVLQATSSTVDHNSVTVSLPSSHTETPVVLSQTQTRNGTASVNTRQHSVTTSTVDVRLQEQEADNGTHNDETVGIISFGK